MNEQINGNQEGMDNGPMGSNGSQDTPMNQPDTSWQGATQSELDQAEAEQAAYSPPDKKSVFNKNSIFFMGACVLAVLMMYIFGMKNKPTESSAQDIEAETSIDQMLLKLGDQTGKSNPKGLVGESSGMVKMFYAYSSKPQVTLNDLKRNPFERKSKPKAKPVDDLKAIKIALTNKLMTLKLQSVMMGPGGGICNISGHMYSVGKKVVDTFEIKAVGSDHVTLTSAGFEFILKM